MKTKSMLSLSILAALLAMTSIATAKVSEQTIKNLNAAYQGESNAAHRYGLFAKTAEQEGMAQVAKLFRAASEAEAIHRETHKKAIIELGGQVANFQLDEVKPGTTAENLKASIKGESYERDTMYPEFLKTAKADDARPAIRTLEFARAAEKEHATLYQQALDQLGKNPPADYYVCKVCGFTVTELPAKKCVSCRNPKSEYRKIS